MVCCAPFLTLIWLFDYFLSFHQVFLCHFLLFMTYETVVSSFVTKLALTPNFSIAYPHPLQICTPPSLFMFSTPSLQLSFTLYNQNIQKRPSAECDGVKRHLILTAILFQKVSLNNGGTCAVLPVNQYVKN